MFGKSDASTSTTDDVKVRPLWVYYFPQALGILSAEPPCALPAGGGAMWGSPAPRAPRHPGALLRPTISPATTLLTTDEPWLSSSSSEPRRLVPYTRLLPPLRLPTPRSFSPDDSDDFWPLPARLTKLSLPPIDIPQLEMTESPLVSSFRSRGSRSPRAARAPAAGRAGRGVRKRRYTRLAHLQRVVAALPRRTLHGGAIPLRCSAALRAALRELRAAWTPLHTPHTYIVSRSWSRSERELVCEKDSQRSSEAGSAMSRRAMWAELGARPGASPGLLRRRYSAPETIMRKYRLEQQREAWCSSAGTGRSPASSPARAPRAPLVRRALLHRAAACPHAPHPTHPAPAVPAQHMCDLDVLEIVVSESVHATPLSVRAAHGDGPPPSLPADIDEYVSSVLVESLNSLTDRIESAISCDARMSIVEKEIKVRLQNTGVNTIVHLSPTSNNQIIFGNEELCNRDDARDECNNRVEAPPDPTGPPQDDNNNPPAAVLRQLQRLFHKSLSRDASPEVSRVEISNVDVYLDSSGESPAMISVTAGAPAASLEARAGSCGGSPQGSLVDSLDDPASPRRDVLALLPASPRAPPAAFFVGIDDAAPPPPRVADTLPARLRQRLQRRQRRRQQRAESRRRRPAARDAAALLDALVDDLISVAARDELRAWQSERRKPEVRRERPQRDPLEQRLDAEKRAHQLRGRLSLQPHPPITQAGNPRRLYQKSEITEGSKRVEILEILEYVDSSSSSPEASPGDEAATRRRSRIPVPVSGARRDDDDKLRRLLRAALGAQAAADASSPPAGPPESRARSNSLRFRRVFEAIPEELSGAGAAGAGAGGLRSAGTSPPPRGAQSRATMTSPARRVHAATSPRRPAPAPAASASPPRLPAEEQVAPPPAPAPAPVPAPAPAEDSSSSCEERGLLCVLPRRRRAARRRPAPLAPPAAPAAPKAPLKLHQKPIASKTPPPQTPDPKRELEVANVKAASFSTTDAGLTTRTESGAGVGAVGVTATNVTGVTSGSGSTGWSVTVAGERVPPHELQLRLRFPPAPAPPFDPAHPARPQLSSTPDTSRTSVACACRHCCVPGTRALPPAHPAHPPHSTRRGSSRACDAPRLPSLRRDSLGGQAKTRRARSPRCWPTAVPRAAPASCLQVVGAAVVPLPRAARRPR